MSREQGAVCSRQRGAGCQVEDSEFCSFRRVVKDLLEDESARRNIRRRFLGQWFRCHPVLTLVLMVLLVSLVLALVVALAVQSAPQLPVPPATPRCVFWAVPLGWVGYNGLCYCLSRDSGTWEQGQERCSELGASLAIVKDEEDTDLLFHLRGNVHYWLRAGACSGGTAATSAPGLLSLAIPSVCAWLTINFGVRGAQMSGRTCAARPKSSPVTGAGDRTFSTLGSPSFTS